jgi:hypothetical protein
MTSKEAVKLGEELWLIRECWEGDDQPQATMPCPNGKTWGELTDAEREEYRMCMWWANMCDWVAWQTKH